MRLCPLLFITGLLLIQPSAHAKEHSVFSQIDESIRKTDIPKAKSEVDQFQETHSDWNKNYDYLWRAARVYTLWGDYEKTKAAQEGAYTQAHHYAKQAILLDSDKTIGYVRRAAAAGKLALLKGPFSALNLVTEVKRDSERAIQLNNSSNPRDLAVAYYILGRAHFRLLEKSSFVRSLIGLGWANLQDALKHLKKATEIDPDFIMFHLDYAIALIEDHQKETAKMELQKLLNLPLIEFGDDIRKQDAKKLLLNL